MGLADLHVHTIYSDGSDTPTSVIELALGAGLSCVSVTDHDTLQGLPEASVAAEKAGIELIPGIEFSASCQGREVHMLGFLVEASHDAFQKTLTEQRARRTTRIHEMVERLQQVGAHITAEQVFAHAGEGAVGRPHVAEALVQGGYVKTRKEAFNRFIGADGPAYIPGSPMAPKRAIEAIRGAGGIPVLAHPVYLEDDTLIDQFVKDGLVGIEVYHGGHTPEVVARYEQLADRLSLLKTGGSDYHGAAKEGTPIGSTTIPTELVDALKQWKAEHH